MGVSNRLSQISKQLTVHHQRLSNNDTMAKVQSPDQLPWDPNCTQFPSRKELPKIDGAPNGAAWVWGKDDQVRCGGFLQLSWLQNMEVIVS